MKTSDHIYQIEFITEEEHPKRGVVILVSDDNKMNAKTKFDKLKTNTERHFRTRFDAWKDGKLNKKWYHGWNQTEFGGKYALCFVFKYKSDRFYGFLCNPKTTNRAYQICVLATHINKHQDKTDEADLKEIESIRTMFLVNKAIEIYFKGKK
jgi:hypothetical protein